MSFLSLHPSSILSSTLFNIGGLPQQCMLAYVKVNNCFVKKKVKIKNMEKKKLKKRYESSIFTQNEIQDIPSNYFLIQRYFWGNSVLAVRDKKTISY